MRHSWMKSVKQGLEFVSLYLRLIKNKRDIHYYTHVGNFFSSLFVLDLSNHRRLSVRDRRKSQMF